jgi:hypothetical protein
MVMHYRLVHGGLKRALGVTSKDHATPEQIQYRHQLLVDAVMSSEMPAWIR